MVKEKTKQKVSSNDGTSSDDFVIKQTRSKDSNKSMKINISRKKSHKRKRSPVKESATCSESASSDASMKKTSLSKRKRRKRLQYESSEGSSSKKEESDLSSLEETISTDEDAEKSQTKKLRRGRSATQATSPLDSDSDVIATKKVKKLRKKKSKKKKKKSDVESTPGGRRAIRSILANDQLREETIDAEKQEEERRQRLKERSGDKIVDVHLKESGIGSEPVPITKRLVLQKDPLVEVHHDITIHLKPHQVEGIQFIWDNLIESTTQAKEQEGGGCILAHCMGLGKTLQTITVVHTILNCPHLKLKTVLVVAPLNTLLNWIAEFVRWVPDEQPVELYNLTEYATRQARRNILEKWRKTGGVMVIGYDMFRLLATGKGIRHKATKICYAEALLDPGPDVIVCDEGHKLKNSEANISITMNNIKSRRRLVLTGTPLQNNLVEYQCMVNFVKKNLLGSLKEFRNRFVNPIINGQHSDSTKRDVRIMKNRCHILHEMLSGFVQRKDYTALAQYLCDKHEFIIKVRLSPLQIKLYQHYLDTCTNRGSNQHAIVASSKDTGLFADYQNLMRVWTHPRILRLHTKRKEIENMRNFVDDSEEDACMTDDEDYKSESDEKSDDNESASKIKSEEKPTDDKESNKPNGIVNLIDSDDETKNTSATTRSMRSRRLKDSEDESEEENSESKEENSESDEEEEGDYSEESEEEKEREKERKPRRKCGRYKLRGQIENSPVKKPRSRLVVGDTSESSDNDCIVTEINGNCDDTKHEDSDTWYAGLLNQQTDAYKRFDVSGKIMVLFEILRHARECNDKVLVFSQSLLSLDLIEEMLALSTSLCVGMETDLPQGGDEESHPPGFHQTWYKNVDYFRMDGSSLGKSRQRWINEFNDVSDERARLFLISTRAGSLGVNLVAANRVVIFDVSWNPSHDIQSIFRVYRFGQTKICYIYRLISQGTMEEKIYDRQVTKQSLAFRVVDEQQINRHFTAHDLQELYSFQPSPIPENNDDLPVHALPKDKLLAEVLVGEGTKHLIASYHQHDSLLDHQETEELTEEERRAAWEEYENEKKGRRMNLNLNPGLGDMSQMGALMSQQVNLPIGGLNFVGPQYLMNEFHRQQVLMKLLLYKQQAMADGVKRKVTVEDITGTLIPCVHILSPEKQKTAKSCLTFMMKVCAAIEETSKRIEAQKSVDIDQMVKALKPLPMYRHMSDDSIKMLAIEVQVRQQQIRAAAEKELKGNMTQLMWFEEKFFKLFFDPTADQAANFVTAQNSTTAAATNKPEEVNLRKASSFARSVFAQLLSSHGGANETTGGSSGSVRKILPKPAEQKSNTSMTSSVPSVQPLPPPKSHVTSNKGKFKFGVTELKPNTEKITEKTIVVAAKGKTPSVGGDIDQSRVNDVTKAVVNVPAKTLADLFKIPNPSGLKATKEMTLKPVVEKIVIDSSDSEPGVSGGSEEEGEEEDWELKYMKNSKSRRRRAL
uniref:Transcriptional regulator ATRX n=1 Tax=Phallusia mammillata TaxID=59560 RepID=A0A6F9D826_9ASCI|nr:transcriptional regulator ATRX [Phallusia mammillata]